MFRRTSPGGRLLGDRPFRQERPDDARSVVIVALRAPALTPARVEDHATGAAPGVPHSQIVWVRTSRSVASMPWCASRRGWDHRRSRCFPGVGAAREPRSGGVGRSRMPPSRTRLVDDIARYDEQRKESNGRIRAAVAASGTTLTEIFGIGDVIAATLIGHTGDPFDSRKEDKFAVYNGTAPVELVLGEPEEADPPVSWRGDRHHEPRAHIAVVTELRHAHSPGRGYYDRKRAEGHTTKTAIRALKRRISNLVDRHRIADAQRTSRRGRRAGRKPGNDSTACAAGDCPDSAGASQQRLPNPTNTLRPQPALVDGSTPRGHDTPQTPLDKHRSFDLSGPAQRTRRNFGSMSSSASNCAATARVSSSSALSAR